MTTSKSSYTSEKTKTTEQIPCFLKDGSKREDPTKIRREDGFCVPKKCDSSSILNPETGECIDKLTKKGKKLSDNNDLESIFSDKNLKEIQDNRYKLSKPKRKKRNSKPSSSAMRKPCRDDQTRNPETGRCKFVKEESRIPSVRPETELEKDIFTTGRVPTVTPEEAKEDILTPGRVPEEPKDDTLTIGKVPIIPVSENHDLADLQNQIDKIFNSISEIKNNMIISRTFSDSKLEKLRNEIQNLRVKESPLNRETDNIDSLRLMIDTKFLDIQEKNTRFIDDVERKIRMSLLSIERDVPREINVPCDTSDKNIEILQKIIEGNMTLISNLLTIQGENKNNNDEIENKTNEFISDMKTQNKDHLRVLESFISNIESRIEKIEKEEKKIKKIVKIPKSKSQKLNININNNNDGIERDIHFKSLFTLSEKNVRINNNLAEQEVPEIIRGIRFSTTN